MGQDLTAKQENTAQIDRNNLLPLLNADLCKGGRLADRGIVDQDANLPELSQDSGDRLLDLFFLGPSPL